MATNVDELTHKQHKALAALLSEPTVTAAAATCGIGERTLHKWLHDVPAFVEAYAAVRHDAVGQAVARLQHATGIAVDALLDVLDVDAPTPAAVRVSAAKVIIEYALRFRELDELESRIAALENSHA
jgi:hypothetical protein